MAAKSHFRGHPIQWDSTTNQRRYCDTGEPTVETWKSRPCGHCGLHDTPEGHDGCLGTLPGVRNASCGHGREAEAYLQFADGEVIRGAEAIGEIEKLHKETTNMLQNNKWLSKLNSTSSNKGRA